MLYFINKDKHIKSTLHSKEISESSDTQWKQIQILTDTVNSEIFDFLKADLNYTVIWKAIIIDSSFSLNLSSFRVYILHALKYAYTHIITHKIPKKIFYLAVDMQNLVYMYIFLLFLIFF